MKRDAPKGYVYIVCWSASGPIKIGWSTAPRQRLAGLQTSMPYKLHFGGVVRVVHAKKLESGAHSALADKRLQGEWFGVEPDAAWDMLCALAAAHDEKWSVWKPATRNVQNEKARRRIKSASRRRDAIDEYNRLKGL